MEIQGTPANAGKITTLLVDDEIGAINTLQGMLGQYCPQVHIVGTALSVHAAVEAAAALQPDLVFLDIEMPPLGTGFDFLKQVDPSAFGIIFTTAYPQFAIHAINQFQPWAYLLKPYTVAELKAAVQVAEDKIRTQGNALLYQAQRQTLVVQDSRKGSLLLRAGEVAYCKAGGSFTDIFTWRKNKIEKITSSRNLGEHEAELPALLFCRTHHSYLVNMAFVERFERTGRNGVIHLHPPGHRVDVSVAKMDIFLRHLDEFCQMNAR
ncbi:MAG: response regulator transcription factor [Saprospirales bacterium]|nr:response regulator transcription factor [Saprospirales bacterium]MBK8922675.1 response regulator transcription factor [Saprospirales bacterium]